MAIEVLQDKLQITNARQELIRRGVSFTESEFRSFFLNLFLNLDSIRLVMRFVFRAFVLKLV